LAGSGPYLNSHGKPHHHPNCKGLKQGRWTKDEHFRFLEALKLYGKEWRKVQLHVCTRTSTQARSHAQKFFVKVEKRNQTLEEFLDELDLQHLENHYIFSDLEEEEEEEEPAAERGHFKVMRN
jgi:SHAQKYF class myb-like DNA-binding protein